MAPDAGAETTYGMTRATFSIANQKAYARKAVQAADRT